VLSAVVLTQYRRVTDGQTDGQTDGRTDGQTDGIAVANTALAMRSRPKYDSDTHFDPHFEEVRGGVEPWWMARSLVGKPLPSSC